MCVLVRLCFCIPGKRAGGCPQTPTANSSTVTVSGVATAGGHKHRMRQKIQYRYWSCEFVRNEFKDVCM